MSTYYLTMITTPINWRALCAELTFLIESAASDILVLGSRETLIQRSIFAASLMREVARIRAYLAQPEPQGPTDEEIDDQFFAHCYTDDFGNELMEIQQFRKGARAFLARWGHPALAQPELQEMTDQDLLKIYCDARREFYFKHAAGDSDKEDRRAATIYGLHIVLARWGRPAIEPVPVAERPWEREGWCDADGKCWWGRPSEELCNSDWFLATRAEVEEFCDCFPPVVSLPYWALPVPTAP